MKRITTTLLSLIGIFIPLFVVLSVTGTIDSTYKYAWANNVGWINFGCSDCNVQVTDTAITGYAWAENVGWINLDPSGSAGLTNTTAGNVGGSAWGEIAGWVDFDNVSINSSGQFTGTATGDVVGTVVFSDCGSGCGVKTNWTPAAAGPDGGGGTFSYHNVCSNNQCISALGAGTNACQVNADCQTTHTECQEDQCVSVVGLGINQCQGNNDCAQPKHNICQNDQCILADGPGADLCQSNFDCIFSHTECQNNQCLQVQGIGLNQCQTNGDCLLEKHTVCLNKQCILFDGPGLDLCQTNVDCGEVPVTQQHLTCQNQKCVLINGAGLNTCQTDNDCAISNPPPPPPDENPPPIDPEEITKEVINTATKVITGVNEFIKTTPGQVATTVVSTAGFIGGLITALSLALFTPGVIFEVFFIPFRLASLAMAAFGMRKKVAHWGIVYDSVTKQPLDPVRVSLVNDLGKEIASTITDIDGRYGFLVDAGHYKIVANKTHYDFPSKKMAGKTQDELYDNLYFGEQIEIKQKGDVIKKNIPLDSLGFDWNEFAKSHKRIMKFYSKFDLATRMAMDIIFGVGFVIAVWAYFTAPAPYNVAIVILYCALLALKILVFKPKSFGSVAYKADGQPLSFGVLRIISPSTNVEVGHKITDAFGRYYCLIPKGKYYINVEEREADGSYRKIFTSPVVDASRKGIIKTNFKV